MTIVTRTLLAAFFVVCLALPARADFEKGNKAFQRGDYQTALSELLPLAKQGDPKSQHILAEMYADGLGVDQDYAAALKWNKLSAEQDYAPAMADLGDLYYYGNGVHEDQAEALKWYQKGAEKGDPAAEYAYGLLFHDGSAGLKQDFGTAFNWFLRAAAQGDAEAINMVGYMHDAGEGMPEDPKEAYHWYRKAAEKGYDISEYNLGVMFQSGRGVDKDPAEAARWYRKAADQGDADSEAALGYLYEQGLGLKADIALAIRWYRQAARQGSSRALNNLGVLSEDGTGVPRSLITAYVLYAMAAEKASDPDDKKLAQDNRNDLAKKLSQEELAKAKDVLLKAAGDPGLILPEETASADGGKTGSVGTNSSTNNSPGATNRSTVPPSQSGNAGGLVGSVKLALAALGYDPGNRDNTLSDSAVAAIKAFQKDHGLQASGEISGDLLAALLAARYEAGDASKPINEGSKLQLYATGSGFYVSAAGHIVTNQHVVDGCKEMRLAGGMVLQMLVADKANDLALLKAPRPGAGFVRFRDGHGVRTGESILIAGFPLRDEISSEINVTTGNVSSLAGPDNDRTLIQITAPVQHGNSGGPVLDLSGNLVGVVQSKFDPSADAGSDNTIDVPQNVNFAVSANTLRSFLDAQEIEDETAPSKDALSTAAIAQRAHDFTVSLECWQ
jgi:TPR repeat protein/S1-C subfamily serine protease